MRADFLFRNARRSALWRDERGNFAVLFAISGTAMILIMGLGVDYFVGVSAKSRLDAASDAAALAAVNAAKAYYQQNAGSMSQTQLVTNAESTGQTVGANAFQANVSSTVLTGTVTPSFQWGAFTSMTFSATVTWSGSVPTFFGALANVDTLALSGSSTATSEMPLYEDFYVLTDVSGSMGIPTSVANQQLLMSVSPDGAAEGYPNGCQFACHFPGYSGFTISQQSNGSGGVYIPLKLNDVGSALINLLSTATANEVIANQYRVGIYTYIDNVIAAAAMSTNLTQTGPAGLVANNLANYADGGGSNQGMGSGGTHFSSIWSSFKQNFLTTAVGDGSSPTSTKPFVIIVSDGIDNQQSYSNGNWSAGGSEPVIPDTTSSASVCAAAKAAGYTVAVVLIPYNPIYDPDPTFANDEDGTVNYYIDPSAYSKDSNAITTLSAGETVVTNMQACATSSEWFFQATSSAAINSAMQTIFFQATDATRLTQ